MKSSFCLVDQLVHSIVIAATSCRLYSMNNMLLSIRYICGSYKMIGLKHHHYEPYSAGAHACTVPQHEMQHCHSLMTSLVQQRSNYTIFFIKQSIERWIIARTRRMVIMWRYYLRHRRLLVISNVLFATVMAAQRRPLNTHFNKTFMLAISGPVCSWYIVTNRTPTSHALRRHLYVLLSSMLSHE